MSDHVNDTTEHNPAAFPLMMDTSAAWHFQLGMTLRDYFAGQALVGLDMKQEAEGVAVIAYQFADAMLEARNKGAAQ